MIHGDGRKWTKLMIHGDGRELPKMMIHGDGDRALVLAAEEAEAAAGDSSVEDLLTRLIIGNL
jgi:hypothetical protein